MNRLLRNKDYYRQIQEDDLNQIIETDPSSLTEVEQSAQEEMKSFLAQRYITDQIFTNTEVFATSSVYYGKNLVEYTEAEFDQQTTYAPLDRVSYSGSIYYNSLTSSIIGVSPEDTSDWTFVTEDLSLYYANLPYTEWSPLTTYDIGDIVWYQDVVYTASKESIAVKPTDDSYWTAGATYSFSNVVPTDDTTKWTKGDNRNQLIVMYLIDITLYHLHSRINPRNIPILRCERYDGKNNVLGGAIGWLRRVSDGNINATLPEIVPDTGLSIQWGDAVSKKNNSY